MSITAFPVLARIIYERGIAGTAVGSLDARGRRNGRRRGMGDPGGRPRQLHRQRDAGVSRPAAALLYVCVVFGAACARSSALGGGRR